MLCFTGVPAWEIYLLAEIRNYAYFYVYLSMKVYYWTGKKNFGDLLTDLLIKRFTRLNTELTSPENSELVMCGSLLGHLPSDYSGVIAGCGKLHDKEVKFPNAKILAVRGPLTMKAPVYADPGLLANELVPLEDKEYNLGIVPHWTDTKLEFRFKEFHPKIIRVSDDPLQVISEIGKCKKIVTSSLHGVILADAFGIPRRVEIAEKLLANQWEGGLFKFEDYSASIGETLEIGVTKEIDKNKIIEKQHELFDIFEEIASIFSQAS